MRAANREELHSSSGGALDTVPVLRVFLKRLTLSESRFFLILLDLASWPDSLGLPWTIRFQTLGANVVQK
jgi:hypothetical protein